MQTLAFIAFVSNMICDFDLSTSFVFSYALERRPVAFLVYKFARAGTALGPAQIAGAMHLIAVFHRPYAARAFGRVFSHNYFSISRVGIDTNDSYTQRW